MHLSAGNTTAQVVEDGHNVGSTFGNVEDLTFSPDGTQLAFEGILAGGKGATAVLDGNDVGGIHQHVGAFVFSSDGKFLTFTAVDATGSQVITVPA
jgi:Tol biopolymer transport system component